LRLIRLQKCSSKKNAAVGFQKHTGTGTIAFALKRAFYPHLRYFTP